MKNKLKEIVHIGLTISDTERSVKFYRDILGLSYMGEIIMDGEEADRLFGRKNSRARVSYLKGNDNILSPAVELIEFLDREVEDIDADLGRISISEICFEVQDIEGMYNKFKENNVECISSPQEFDFTSFGFGKSKAMYFRDIDGIILELNETIN